MKIKDLAQRAAAYGIPARIVDGNDVLAVYEAARELTGRAREGGGPQLLEVKTFRMKGHAEHDDAGYVPKELFDEWRAKDPIDRFQRHLLGERLASREQLEAIVAELDRQLDADVDFALASPFPPPERALEGVYHEATEP
jgi:TPP-dependent pyruvate/acetoin dehydrogenase alpha subunit